MNSKIAIGTVQFGLNYGVNNKTGVPDFKEVERIFEIAKENNIDTLDTAYNYGKSEEIIGKIEYKIRKEFKIVTKAPKGVNRSNIENYFNESLKRLGVNKIYGYMFHDFEDFKRDNEVIRILNRKKEEGLVLKTGFSLYTPEELEYLLDRRIQFEIIQIPYNLADRRFKKYFKALKEAKIETHIRSVYLQGLFFKEKEELRNILQPFANFNQVLKETSKEIKRSIQSIALNFVLQNQEVDKAVIGIEKAEQLENNIDEAGNGLKEEEMKYLQEKLARIEISKELLIPTNWE